MNIQIDLAKLLTILFLKTYMTLK